MSDETPLLPCPFCGSEAEIREFAGDWIVSCNCEQSNFGVFTTNMQGYGATKAEAIAAWNIRVEIWG